MYKVKKHLLAALGLLILSGSFILGGPTTAYCQAFPVRDVDNPARQPFQAGTVFTIPAGQLLAQGTITSVPTGKRLVIEYVSANILLPSGERIVEFALQSPPRTFSHFLTPTLLGPAGSEEVFCVSQQLRLYASAGQDVLVGASRNGTSGDAIVDVSISGYLVNIP